MEKLKPSEEEIIRLGKKIVEELQFEPSVNTLGRWMSHYVSELILQAESCNSKSETEIIQKECCDIILKLWQNREHLPNVSKPLSELEPIIDLLDALKKDDFAFPYWRQFRNIPDNPTWKGFVDVVKNSSENIFELCFYSAVNSDLLEKKKHWINEHKNMLAEEEKELFVHLEHLVNRSKDFFTTYNEKEEEINFDELSYKERYKAIFNKIEVEIQDVMDKLKELRKSILNEDDEK